MATETKEITGMTPQLQEEVVEMLPVFIRMLNLIKLVSDAMTEETIEHTMARVEKASNLLVFLEDERVPALLSALLDKADGLLVLMDRLSALQQNGTLDKLLELSEALGVVTDSLTEHSIQHLSAKALPVLELGDRLLASPFMTKAPELLAAVEKTSEQMERTTAEPISVFGLLKLMKQTEVQQALRFGTTLLRNLSSIGQVK